MSVVRASWFVWCWSLVASTGSSQVWIESDDAGSFPDLAAQVTQGTGGLTSIMGSTGGSDLRDAYCIKIVDPETFLATTDPNTDPGANGEFDTRFFLFDEYGAPVLANDNTPVALSDTLLSTLTGAATDDSGFVLSRPGEYVLVVAGFSDGPEDPANLSLFDIASNLGLVHAPSPLAGRFNAWAGGSPETGQYTVVLAGVNYCQGAVEAVFVDWAPNHVCQGDSTGEYATCSDVSADSNTTRAVALGFIDQDANLDAVFGGIFGDHNQVCLGDGAGRFGSCENVSADPYFTSHVAFGFMNRDYNLDAVFANFKEENKVCLGNGDGTFLPCSDLSADLNSSNEVALGFIDGDSNLDAVFANEYDANTVCLGNGDGTFRPCTTFELSGSLTYEVALGLVNEDANLDAVFANADLNSKICLGKGDGTFEACTNVSSNIDGAYGVELGFVDGDSTLDAVFASFLGQNHVCLGNGDGTFKPCTDIAGPGSGALSLALGFVDGDSNLDAVFAQNSRGLVCLGHGDGDFAFCSIAGFDPTTTRDVELGELGHFETSIFADGFESGDTSAWSSAVP